ncbi:hypothetical protein [Pelomonas cellulosilytica]|uniref:Uncharacterized protein n=1 Tax=Pelomonas cellulosilytica TaxID=2906762 RepID=A0ABS8XQT4_9BURK|nr:hypothetical protein [Pelomonas sp. P8]MCE4555101.1 hypothetical protein [Pelomonas sp. P8]
MHPALTLFGERSLTLVAATFHDGHSAARAAQAVGERSRRKLGIFVVTPRDPHLARKLEPESHGIWCTLLRSHGRLGVAGAALGLLMAGLLLGTGWPAAVASPVAVLGLGLVYGAFTGFLVAGLLTLRPDRVRVICDVRDASEHGRWTVVTHPTTAHDAAVALSQLGRVSGQVLRSL